MGCCRKRSFTNAAEKFALLKNVDGKYFTLKEYEELIKENQTDKNKSLVYLYATDKDEQFSYIEAAKAKGYDVLLDGRTAGYALSESSGAQVEGFQVCQGRFRYC